MRKHKKTRQQKIIADLRRQLMKEPTYTIPSIVKEEKNVLYSSPNHTALYTFEPRDLIKTGIVTGILVLSEIILLFLFKNRLISILSLSY